jgi:hypothetical protein
MWNLAANFCGACSANIGAVTAAAATASKLFMCPRLLSSSLNMSQWLLLRI